MKIEHPEQFQQSNPQISPSSLSVIPKFPNLGIMGMTEILTALQLLGGITDQADKKPSTITFADVFEQAFGFGFNGIYDRQRELFNRKPYNLTKTLDALKAVLMKEYKKRNVNKEEENKDAKR